MESITSLRDVQDTLTSCRQLSQRVHGYAKRHQSDWDTVGQEVNEICTRIKCATAQISALPEDSPDRTAMRAIVQQCNQLLKSGPGGDLHKFRKKSKNPLVLSLLLGNHSTVVTVRKDEAFRMKQEYHSFRSRMALYMLLICGLMVFLMRRARHMHFTQLAASSASITSLTDLTRYSFHPVIMAGVQVFLVFMVYVYIAFAARESVLLMNGSNIRSWWIIHHYFSAIACTITLALPVDSRSVQDYIESWLIWTMAQALLILVQNRYQQQRMYTRVALGKDSAIDVVGGESSGVPGQLLMLLPFLFALQAWQMILGFMMFYQSVQSVLIPEGWLEMETHESDLRGLRGTCIVGLMLATMGLMNGSTTFLTIHQKFRAASLKAASAKKQT